MLVSNPRNHARPTAQQGLDADRRFICGLSGERIEHMLVNERRCTMRNRVSAQLIVRGRF